MPPTRQVVSLILVVVIIFGAFYIRHLILRRVSGHGKTRNIFKNRNIAVIDRFSIAKDKSFCLVEVAGNIYFVAMTNNAITLLDKLDSDAFAKASEETRDTGAMKIPVGNSLKDRMTRGLAVFIAKRMGRTLEFEDEPAANNSTFAETMKSTSEKDAASDSAAPAENISDCPEDKA